MKEVTFQAVAILTCHTDGKKTNKVKDISIHLDIGPGLDHDAYFDPSGVHTAEGAKALSQTLVMGLVANIHSEHQKGRRDSAEHLRAIIAQLEKGFVHQVEASDEVFLPVAPIPQP